jgi:hypothetical protein
VEIGTLELISSRNSPIHSLSISYETYGHTTDLTISSFQDLNLSELQKIAFWEVPWDHCRDIMDLALQSSCHNMSFIIDDGLPNLDLFKHRLLDQVTDITIVMR